jgi:hypothetical protein
MITTVPWYCISITPATPSCYPHRQARLHQG